MKNQIDQIILVVMILGNCLMGFSQNKEIPLWDTIPGKINSTDYKETIVNDETGTFKALAKVTVPTLTQYLAEKSNGTAVIICPGGGYTHAVVVKEGYKVAKWLNSMGISAFVLKYRMPSDKIMKDKSIGPLQDAQEAMRIVRRNATKWKIDPNKIGIMGFSAGGHLAATVSNYFAENVYTSTDNTSARPDFEILIYPVISMEEEIAHKGSRRNLLGENPTAEAVEKFSMEKQVRSNTPKTFLIHASDDKSVPVQNSIFYYLALKQHGIPVEMHIYGDGGHGFNLGNGGTNINWPLACEKWLDSNGFLSKKEQ